MAPTPQDRFRAYTGRLVLVWIFFSFFLQTLYRAILAFDFPTLLSLSSLRAKAFAAAFANQRSDMRAYEASTEAPALVSSAYGRVLELGPGIGNQVDRFDRAKVQHVTGLEPNGAMLPLLHRAVADAGLERKYVIVHAGAEDSTRLEEEGLVEGTLDCVVSIQVLCSVPEPEKVIGNMYRLLKKGGQMIVWEHCACQDPWGGLAQRLINPFWRFSLDGCRLDRPLGRWLRAAGPWAQVELEQDDETKEAMLMPRVWGRLVK